MFPSEKIKNRFQELVKSTGLSKTECAKQIGISYNTFNKIYNYGKLTRIFVGQRIVNYFKISHDYLLCLSDDKEIKRHRH